jgi:hypothetical protein
MNAKVNRAFIFLRNCTGNKLTDFIAMIRSSGTLIACFVTLMFLFHVKTGNIYLLMAMQQLNNALLQRDSIC